MRLELIWLFEYRITSVQVLVSVMMARNREKKIDNNPCLAIRPGPGTKTLTFVHNLRMTFELLAAAHSLGLLSLWPL